MKIHGHELLDGNVLIDGRNPPICVFSHKLTIHTVRKYQIMLMHSESIFNIVHKLLSDGHIKTIVKNLDELNTAYSNYEKEQFAARRSIKDED